MKTLARILSIITVIVITACNSNTVYNEHKDLSTNMQWNRSDKIQFTPEIKDIESNYTLLVALRHVKGYPYPNLKFKIATTSPSGSVSEKEYDMQVMNEHNEYNGEGMGDLWDLEVPVELNYKFTEAGKYSFEIEHTMPQDPVQLAIEIGVKIEKNKE